MTEQKSQFVYIIAGEPSGDLLGARLMQQIKAQAKMPLYFVGVGGDKMKAEGLKSLFPYLELSHVGMTEILPHLVNIFARIDQTVDDIKTKEPIVLITIDCPGFCKRVVKKLRKDEFNTRYIHYVAPSVWAWRPKRAISYAEVYDHLLCLLPFEPPLFEREGLASTFVGHTVASEQQIGDGKAFRLRYELANDVPVFCVFPGSRQGEITRHMPIFARAISLLAEAYPNLAIVVPIPKHMLDTVRPYFQNCPFRAIVTTNEEDKRDALATSNVAIVKSGTIALEVATSGTPMVVAYRVSAITAFVFRRLRITKLVTLVNILLGREAIPELLQEECSPTMIANATAAILRDESLANAQKVAMQQALTMLIPASKPPSAIAAEVVLGMIES
jgi:lipid-A-disaccharide synthase